MRLVHTELGIDICFLDNTVNVIVIENPKIMTNLLCELHDQIEGGKGGFVLSQGDKLLSLAKNIVYLLEPVTVSLNDRKIMNKIYQEINEAIEENFIVEKAEVNARLVQYIERILERIQYPLIIEPELDSVGMVKLFGVKIEESYSTLVERLIEYIKLLSQLCGYPVFVFVNIKMYLTKEEIRYLYESVFYSKVKLILIENIDRGFEKDEIGYIIDKDGCLISLEK